MSLSVCIICKDEEKNIRRCLESIKNIANEIIVVDTGSSDKTIEIVKEYKVTLINHRWNNDFSDARNISIKKATCDWILILDADEEMDRESGLRLLEIIKNHTEYEGLFVSLINVIENREVSKAVVFRVFKNNFLYRFSGKIHEQILPHIYKYHSQSSILDTDIKILHYGYDLTIDEEMAKLKRNLDILLSYKEEERDGYYYFALGNEFIMSSDFTACIKSYEKAIELTDFPKEKPIFLPYLLFNLIELLLEIGEIEDANKYFKFYIEYFNDFKELYFLGALSELALKRYYDAKKYMDKYRLVVQSNNLYPSNNLEGKYNMIEINKAIELGLFLVRCKGDKHTME